VCCEDTRVTGLLLSRLGIKNQLSSLHQFTAPSKIDSIVKRIRDDKAAVAIVSDAGILRDELNSVIDIPAYN